jgi:hypothetical protein
MATLADLLRSGYTPPTDSPMVEPIKQHFKSLPQKLQTNTAEQMALLGQAFPGNTYESMMTQGDPKAMAELAMQVPFNALTAFHGTPHKIKGAFDINKVGTGEGAQVYGHGMYFAENPKVAGSYKESVKNREGIKTLQDQILDLRSKQKVATTREEADKLLNAQNALIEQRNAIENAPGNLYKVDIPDEYIPTMLEWDKSLGEQSPFVKKAINSLKKQVTPQMMDELGGDLNVLFGKDVSPAQFLNTWEIIHPESKIGIGEEMLNKAGVKGVKYLDNFSRDFRMLTPEESTSGKYVVGKWPGNEEQKYFDNLQEAQDYFNKNQTHNFVVFDPSTVKILEENGKALTRKEVIEKQIKDLK